MTEQTNPTTGKPAPARNDAKPADVLAPRSYVAGFTLSGPVVESERIFGARDGRSWDFVNVYVLTGRSITQVNIDTTICPQPLLKGIGSSEANVYWLDAHVRVGVNGRNRLSVSAETVELHKPEDN